MSEPGQLAAIRAERGYLLSYHEVYARTEPGFLEAYTRLYRRFTLDERHLSARERELIWVGLLVADEEAVGTLHVERGYAAGLTTDEMAQATAVAGAAAAWRPIFFAARSWSATLPMDGFACYHALLAAAAPDLSGREADLIAVVVHAVHQQEEAFLHHLDRLYAAGVQERDVAEAISYLLLPRGANALLWATDQWLAAVESGRITPTGELAGVNTRTRRS
ncbi:carboxymuconolactone decarboxylase family protein [Micromonospora sp. C28ISP2-4]|uniref:carboxymuconolactone decarboxylase family protein n=1 Tax=Micromonospora sp. C28ISP2-4 TaxID=3059523 RepID=UPI00267447C1|nr:carboxymuconolactone decarboxylase family protein [Micromonospora sp. C28ISP2-4]MDO3684946.1 carboxymuconolactone decarboxylase family protein [Micromonospora sp. C28ISP2-4]